MKRGWIIGILLLGMSVGVVQADKMADIRKNREQTLKELSEANKNLDATLKQAKASLNELNSITADIKEQKRLIDEITAEIAKLRRQQQAVENDIALLQKELEQKKQSYAEAVRQMSCQRSDYDKLMFIFSASSLGESYRRARYLREYSDFRKQQAEEIRVKTKELEGLQAQLQASINEQQIALQEQEAEQAVLKQQEALQKELVAGLKKQEKQLRQEITKKNKAAKALDRKLEQLMAEEARKAAERAKKEAEELAKQEGKKPGKTPDNGYKMPSADVTLAKSFAKNKGKLPPPLSSKYKIVSHYGVQKHPSLPNIEIENLGVSLETVAGAKAKAVFEGKVISVLVEPGYNSAIVLRHGDYYTLYANLDEVYVKVGDKVETKQEIGRIYSDPEDNNRTILEFRMNQVNKGSVRLNPEQWLNL